MSLRNLYTEKQEEILRRLDKSDWFILGLHGAKRTGKTILNNDIFLRELLRVKKIATEQGVSEPQYILAGFSSKTIQNNILQELYNRYGLEIKFDKHNSFTLFGVKVVQAFTGNIGGVGGIRGMTSYGAYINEASLANEFVFKEIITRCSGEGARIVFDTNPDNPEHWLKKEYIDSEDENIISYHFKLDDNTFLSERYRRNIKAATPTGMFYERDINGLWVTGEGVVYSDFDSSKHYVDDVSNMHFKKIFAGVDWGYKHYGAIVVVGEDYHGKYYLIKEYAEQFKDIEYWLKVAEIIRNKYGDITFYCDDARPEYIDKFIMAGLYAEKANKNRLSGIEQIARLFKQDSLFIVSSVKRFREEIYSYIWNKDTGDTIKVFDDVLDALRYAIYSEINQPVARVLNRELYGL